MELWESEFSLTHWKCLSLIQHLFATTPALIYTEELTLVGCKAQMENTHRVGCSVFPFGHALCSCPSPATDIAGFCRGPCRRTQYGCFYTQQHSSNWWLVGWCLTTLSARGWYIVPIVVHSFNIWRNTTAAAKIKQTRNTKNLNNNNKTKYQAMYTHTQTKYWQNIHTHTHTR